MLLANAFNDYLNKRFSELTRLATNIECVDQLMDLLRMQNSIDEILSLISQTTSPQVHLRVAELLYALLYVSIFRVLSSLREKMTFGVDGSRKSHISFYIVI